MNNEQKDELRAFVKRYKGHDRDYAIRQIAQFGFNKQTIRRYWRALNGD